MRSGMGSERRSEERIRAIFLFFILSLFLSPSRKRIFYVDRLRWVAVVFWYAYDESGKLRRFVYSLDMRVRDIVDGIARGRIPDVTTVLACGRLLEYWLCRALLSTPLSSTSRQSPYTLPFCSALLSSGLFFSAFFHLFSFFFDYLRHSFSLSFSLLSLFFTTSVKTKIFLRSKKIR